MRGSCLCGGVRFEVEAAPDSLRYCHCTSCKKLSGGGGTVNFGVPPSAITIVQGQELLQSFTPEGGSAKTFCRVCGTNLFGGGWPDSEITSVRLPAIDSPFEGSPRRHIYTRSLARWETLPDDGLDRFEAQSG